MTKKQRYVLNKMRQGSVIGELSEKANGRYELFTKIPRYVVKSLNDHRFIVERLNKNTVFALLGLGHICKDNFVETLMSPFCRDCWYVCNG